jgi:hypothetical protein
MCCGIRCPYCRKLFEPKMDYRETNDYIQMSDEEKAAYLESAYHHKCEERIIAERGEDKNGKNNR